MFVIPCGCNHVGCNPFGCHPVGAIPWVESYLWVIAWPPFAMALSMGTKTSKEPTAIHSRGSKIKGAYTMSGLWENKFSHALDLEFSAWWVWFLETMPTLLLIILRLLCMVAMA